jgi:hypothetical protein
MARWTVIKSDLSVIYEDIRGKQDCGKATSPQAKLDDIFDWTVRNADPGDVIISPDGILVRGHVPSSGVRRVIRFD